MSDGVHVCLHPVHTCLKKNGTMVWESFLVFVSNVSEVNSLRNKHLHYQTKHVITRTQKVTMVVLYLIKDSIHTHVKDFVK